MESESEKKKPDLPPDRADTAHSAADPSGFVRWDDGGEPPPPARIGRFRIDRELGRGALGVVYLALEDGTDRRFALKLLSEANDEIANHRFAREARALAQIAHENVIAIRDWGEDQSRPYYVMDVLDGESLADLVERSGTIEPDRIARIARDVLAGLGAVHERGIIHRDVKPTNVMIDAASGRAVVIDFSIARLPDVSIALTRQGFSVGTPTYMAPEQIRGETIGPPADLYALGVTLWFATENRSPYEDCPSYDDLARAKLDRPPPAITRPDVPPALARFIERLMATEPRDRFKDAAAAIAALAPVFAAPSSATSETPPAEKKPPKPWWRVFD